MGLFNMTVKEYKIVPPPVGLFDEIAHLGILTQIPWSHNVILMEKLSDIEERSWYAKKTIEYGWSRDMLSTWIRSKLHLREGQATTNFKETLPPPQIGSGTTNTQRPLHFRFPHTSRRSY
jgi:hypothetical protein